MAGVRPQEEGGTLIEEEIRVEEPKMYKVILLNDDYTTMEFVVLILEQVFRKSPSEAQQIMLNIHERGAGIAGVYTKDVAETKISIVHQTAKANEFPLRCILEEA